MLYCDFRLAAALVVALAAAPLRAQAPAAQAPAVHAPDAARTPINIFRVTDNIAMLMGAGGNVGVSIGEDGTLLIDDQFAASTARIFAVLDSIDRRLIRVVVNTHWHPDHTGGNANVARSADERWASSGAARNTSVKRPFSFSMRRISRRPSSS